MAIDSQYNDSARLRNREQSKHRLTPGSQPWSVAVIDGLRDGYGVEDIALRLGCRADAVRDEVQKLRRTGMMARVYNDEWRRAQALRGGRHG